jgi:hypothetical protein
MLGLKKQKFGLYSENRKRQHLIPTIDCICCWKAGKGLKFSFLALQNRRRVLSGKRLSLSDGYCNLCLHG